MTDDTAAIQSALNAIPSTGGTLFIPSTAGGCFIKGGDFQINTISSSYPGSGSTATVTVQSSSSSVPPNFPTSVSGPNVPLVNIHNVPVGTNGTIFNGTWVMTLVGGSTTGSCQMSALHSFPLCFEYNVTSTASESSTSPGSNAVAEIGLYFNGNNLKVLGASAASGNPSASGSMLVTNTSTTILTTMSAAGPITGPDVQNITFHDAAGAAYAGLNIGTTNGFNISNNRFSGFTAAGGFASHDVQGGAAIVTASGQAVSSSGNAWVQFGKIVNNHINAKIGFTSKFKISSVTFDSNTVQCPTGGTSGNTPIQGTIGLDIGGLWYLNEYVSGLGSGNSSGGENRLINQQTQGCLIGTILGFQNTDRVEEKSENDGTASKPVAQCDNGLTTYCSIGLAVLDTGGSTLFAQAKGVSTGVYIDQASNNNNIYENETIPFQTTTSGSGATLNSLCPSAGCPSGNPSAYTFSTASLMIDQATAAGTTVLGTPSSGTFAPTSNSTFTNDYDPLINTGMTTQSSNYTAALTDSYIVCNSTSAMTITLPTTTPQQLSGKEYKLKNIGAGTCTVVASSGNIDNLPSFPLNQWQGINVVCNGSQYLIF